MYNPDAQDDAEWDAAHQRHLAALSDAALATEFKNVSNPSYHPGFYNIKAEIAKRLEDRRPCDIATKNVLKRVQEMCTYALPKFNWGASFLDAKAIALLNEVPSEVSRVIKQIEG